MALESERRFGVSRQETSLTITIDRRGVRDRSFARVGASPRRRRRRRLGVAALRRRAIPSRAARGVPRAPRAPLPRARRVVFYSLPSRLASRIDATARRVARRSPSPRRARARLAPPSAATRHFFSLSLRAQVRSSTSTRARNATRASCVARASSATRARATATPRRRDRRADVTRAPRDPG